MTIKVNGQTVNEELIKAEAERLRPDYEKTFAEQSPEEREEQLQQWSKENVIERMLLLQEAEKSEQEIPREEIDKLYEEIKKQPESLKQLSEFLKSDDEQKIKEHIELQMKAEKLLKDVRENAPEPSDKQIKQFYKDNKEQFKQPERIRCAHIVKHMGWQADEIKAREGIEQAKKELDNGTPFETLAGRTSDCPDQGGDLGFITRGQMVEEFEDVVFNLGPGQISDVFRTRFGFHIAKVYSRHPESYVELDQIKDKIKEELQKQQASDAVDAYLDELKGKATIQEA